MTWKEKLKTWKVRHPELTKEQVRRAARGCSGKVSYKTLDSAQRAAEIANSKVGHRPLNSPIGAYECQICAAFHIGHTPPEATQ
jgi:hypothetical protein